MGESCKNRAQRQTIVAIRQKSDAAIGCLIGSGLRIFCYSFFVKILLQEPIGIVACEALIDTRAIIPRKLFECGIETSSFKRTENEGGRFTVAAFYGSQR